MSRFKFDDERVTKEDMKRALEEQYGGEEEVVVFWALYHKSLINFILIFFKLMIFHVWFFIWQLPHTNPGFNNSPFKFTKYSNAYMLVYIRESDKDKIICNVDEKDIAEHLRVRCVVMYVNHIKISCCLFLTKSCFELAYNFSDKVEERTRRKRAKEKGKSGSTPIYAHKGYNFPNLLFKLH